MKCIFVPREKVFVLRKRKEQYSTHTHTHAPSPPPHPHTTPPNTHKHKTKQPFLHEIPIEIVFGYNVLAIINNKELLDAFDLFCDNVSIKGWITRIDSLEYSEKMVLEIYIVSLI